MRLLKKLTRERVRLVKVRTMIKNQLHAEKASRKPVLSIVKRAEKQVALLEKQIEAIIKQLESCVKKDTDLDERITNVCTATAIGFITAVSVVSEMNGFALIRNRSQLVSYCGYDVLKNESGTSIKGKEKISKQGNSYVRHALYMPSVCAASHDDHHKNYYIRIVQKTGIHLKASVAIQRKLLLLIFALFTKNEPYNENYHIEMAHRLKQNYKNKLDKAS